ncbi:MAG: response regulator [Desulfobulbaceae bacterium]|nr:response regulator [Desulfobulbaceae bacterium]
MNENLKILFVDDEPDFLETTIKRFTRRGFAVQTAANCADALTIIATGWPQVVVLDYMLPDRDGISCLREIKQRYPALVVVFLSGHASISIALQGIECGANDYCLKPIEIDELIEKIKVAYKEK